MTKIVCHMHSVTVLLMEGIKVKINIFPFYSEPPQKPLGKGNGRAMKTGPQL